MTIVFIIIVIIRPPDIGIPKVLSFPVESFYRDTAHSIRAERTPIRCIPEFRSHVKLHFLTQKSRPSGPPIIFTGGGAKFGFNFRHYMPLSRPLVEKSEANYLKSKTNSLNADDDPMSSQNLDSSAHRPRTNENPSEIIVPF